MNLVDELKSLDANDVGRWPFVFRAGVIGIVFALVVGILVYYFIIEDKMPALERVKQEEVTLRDVFENKQRKAANFDAYKAQLAQMEQSFGTMLRQLPGETEIPSLIVDISQTGLAAGLQEKLFPAAVRGAERFLRREADHDQLVGRLSRNRKLRQRHSQLCHVS